jgi:hypothetical protein
MGVGVGVGVEWGRGGGGRGGVCSGKKKAVGRGGGGRVVAGIRLDLTNAIDKFYHTQTSVPNIKFQTPKFFMKLSMVMWMPVS